MIFAHMTDADIAFQFDLLPHDIYKMHLQQIYLREIQILLETTARAWQYNRRRRGPRTMASTHNPIHASTDTVTSSDHTTSHYNSMGVFIDTRSAELGGGPPSLLSPTTGLEWAAGKCDDDDKGAESDRPREIARLDDTQPAPCNIQASSSTST